MTLIAFLPDDFTVDAALISVWIEPGVIDEGRWINALAARVTRLALAQDDPVEASIQACKILGLYIEDNPYQIGEALVTHNLELRTQLNCLIYKNPFPATAINSDENAEQAMEETDFDRWVDLAWTYSQH
jgi:hypothetical protein